MAFRGSPLIQMDPCSIVIYQGLGVLDLQHNSVETSFVALALCYIIESRNWIRKMMQPSTPQWLANCRHIDFGQNDVTLCLSDCKSNLQSSITHLYLVQFVQ